MLAAAHGDRDAIHQLIHAGTDVDQRGAGGLTALMAAAQAGQSESVAMLLEAGAAVDLVDNTGHSALAFAARRGDATLVERLLAARADARRADADGLTVIMEGVRGRNSEVVDRLAAAGADFRAATRYGQTVLHFGADSSPEMLRRLLGMNLEIDADDARGVTPAMRAARQGRLDLVRMLEAAGADLARVDAQGWTALEHARYKEHWTVVQYLESRMQGDSRAMTDHGQRQRDPPGV